MKENPRPDHRFVIVHFANSTETQIARLHKNGAIFSVNPYYPVGFADKYADGLGQARADTMVALYPLTDARRMLPLDRISDVLIEPLDI